MDFSQFFGGGGGHHHHRQAPKKPKKKVDTQHLYDILAIKKDADEKQIKKAFRKAALKHHPDRGGDPAKFKEVNKANEILGNKEKRALYDKYGEEGVEKGGPGDSGDVFSNFFGGGGGGRKKKQKGQGGLLSVEVTLNDLYNGCVKKAKFNKQFLCDTCGGTGGKNVRECTSCDGKGVKMKIRQIGPGMIQQMQSACDDCKGTGEIVRRQDRCRDCYGKKVYKKIHEFDVHVMKGMKHKQKILFREAGDQAPDIIPGDVHVQLKMKGHKRFIREGAHLFYDKKISLVEALTGFEFTIKTLDKRTLIVQSEPNVLYGSGCIRAIRDEGMPQEGNTSIQGNLYLRLTVKWPKELSPTRLKEIGKILKEGNTSGERINRNNADLEEIELEDVNIKKEKKRWKEQKDGRKKHKGQLDDDDDEPSRGQQTQCQTQ